MLALSSRAEKTHRLYSFTYSHSHSFIFLHFDLPSGTQEALRPTNDSYSTRPMMLCKVLSSSKEDLSQFSSVQGPPGLSLVILGGSSGASMGEILLSSHALLHHVLELRAAYFIFCFCATETAQGLLLPLGSLLAGMRVRLGVGNGT